MSWKRTHTCGELDLQHEGETVILNGWVDVRRDLGGVIFIDLRDRYGVTQIVIDQETEDLHNTAEPSRSEYVIAVEGKVEQRDQDTEIGRASCKARVDAPEPPSAL